jgi:hypothetical protein
MPQKKRTSVFRANLISVGAGQGQMETVPYLISTTEFDINGHVLSQSSFSAEGILTEKISWEYNDQGQIIKELFFTEEEDLSETVTFERDEKGKILKDLKEYMDGSIDTTTYLYDDSNKLIQKTTIDDEGVTDLCEKYTWNKDLLTRHEVSDGENNQISLEEFKYDPKGNILEHKKTDLETGENFKRLYLYNEKGQKVSEELYNEKDKLIETVIYTLDPDGKLISATTEGFQKNSVTRIFYDEQGNNTGQEETNSDGDQMVLVQHNWDKNNNLISSTVYIDGRGISLSQNYELNYEYEWFTED